jgi:hypothetical protein
MSVTGRSAKNRAGVAGLLLSGALVAASSAVTMASAASAAAGRPAQPDSGAVTLNDELAAVSCPNARMCMAVGGGLTERWNGQRWTTEPFPRPAGAIGDGLSGVSCTSARKCTAVGSADISGIGSETLVERWNGKRWAIQPSPSEGTEGSPFAGVSCASATACTAVGIANEDPSTGAENTLAEHWDGTSWVIQPTLPPGPSDATTSLSGVSCTSRKACIAVGENPAVGPMAWRWNGTQWIRQTIGGTDPLNGVSCSSRRRCTAVGYDLTTSGNTLTLAERWNGRRWRIEPTRSPSPG